MADTRDSIDFGRTGIPRLFTRLFIPTLLGLVSGAALSVADGIFVGRGVGSDAIAAVNIAAPLFMVTTGMGLLFGTGVSIVAAVHLSRGNLKAANINLTQAFTVSIALMMAVCAVIFAFPLHTVRLFGGSGRLVPLALEYMLWLLPSMVGMMVMFIGMFAIRLDGSPRFAMLCQAVPSVLNILLDYVFIFPLGMGIKGAAIATSLAQAAGAVMVAAYFATSAKTLGFYRPKFTLTSVRLTARNIGYMARLGMPGFIGETAMALMMVAGNYMFAGRLGEDGVAAFSVACYLFPIVFMVGSAISQAALPIVSYNHGTGDRGRIRTTFRLSVGLAFVCGVAMALGGVFFSGDIAGVFLGESTTAYALVVEGLPYYSLCIPAFSLNLVLIGYYQSIERPGPSMAFMLLRGYVLVLPCFMLLPHLAGDRGLWLAIPLSETATLAAVAAYMSICCRRGRAHA